MARWLPRCSFHDVVTPDAIARSIAISWLGFVLLVSISRLRRGEDIA